MRQTKQFLEALTLAIPPTLPAKHNITTEGGKLIVCIMTESRYYPFELEESDFNKSVGTLVNELVELYNSVRKE